VSVSLLAQLSDPHMRVGPDDAGAARALERAVEALRAQRPAPDAVIVTGDIADGARAIEYERVRELLAPLPMPVHVLPGNHDDRDALREWFGLDGGAGERVQYTARCGALRIVACDTSVPGRDDGELDVEWLAAQVAAEPDAPTIVAMHHLPLPIGLPVLDEIGLPAERVRALGDLLARSPQVRRVVTGHVHRTVAGSLGGCAVLACTSTNLQARLEIGAPDLTWAPEPPAFALHALLDGELVSHVQPVERG
jgi:3',5'-cyclic AMP phosphodiesterase CpdA